MLLVSTLAYVVQIKTGNEFITETLACTQEK